jgi:hypothetical protein
VAASVRYFLKRNVIIKAVISGWLLLLLLWSTLLWSTLLLRRTLLLLWRTLPTLRLTS